MAHPVYARVALRDNWTCQRCGRRAWDAAHILPRGRYPELKHEERNIVSLCRRCHVGTENPTGRRELLELMKGRYGYDYSDERFQRYLR